MRFSGVTRAARRATLSFPQSARLATRSADVGDHVRGGTTLATLDLRPFQNAADAARAAVSEAEARLAQAERDRKRVERLAVSKAATAEEVEHVVTAADAVRAAHAAAEARLAEAHRALSDATLRAPFPGTVTAVLLEPGEMAGAGVPIVELSGDGAVELRVEVSEAVVTHLSAGQPIQAELPFADHARVAGRIESVARAAVGPGRLFPVVVTLDPDPAVRAGMTAELLLALETAEALTVPFAAILDPGSNQPTVFVVRDGKAHRTNVRIGDLVDGRVVVAGELRAGDAVIVAGHTRLGDGDVVEVRS
jgi:RND family efflux transporter MFP subunit